MTNLRVQPSKAKQRETTPQHITLTQASRPSTTSATGTFAGKQSIKIGSRDLFYNLKLKSTGGSFSSVLKEKHRVVVMGAAFVGKTQIVSQFLYDKFTNRYRQTIEELHRGEYELPDGSSLTLDILDTSGAFAFPAMQDLSISTSNAFLLVFSIDNEESWNEVARLREKVNKSFGTFPLSGRRF